MLLLQSLKKDRLIKAYHNIASPKLLRCSVRGNIMEVTFISLKQKLRRCDIIKSQDDFNNKSSLLSVSDFLK